LQVRALPGRLLWRNRRFLSLALGMSAGLFAQIGLLAHLFSVLVPALGAQAAGWAMGFATACAIAGRMFVARLLPAGTHRRVVAALAYGVQLAGSIVLLCVDAQQVAWILLGVALFGSGIGNATSLPPLIAQAEFARLGGLHRNTFKNTPRLLDATLRLKAQPRLRFSGQITGSEGNVESAAVGLMAGRFAAAERLGRAPSVPRAHTAFGAFLAHIKGGGVAETFLPIYVIFGLFPRLA